MQIKDYTIRGIRKCYRFLLNKRFSNPKCELDRQSANDKIYNLLKSDKPCLITRLGTTELICINNYLCIISNEPYLKKLKNFITDNTHTPWWFEDHFKFMNIYSGIFPENKETAKKFSIRYLNDIPDVDLLGSFQYYEKFMPLRYDLQRVHLETMYPFFVDYPWTRALHGKKVLVIHPFEESIRYQYDKRKLLFENADVLPDFRLITLKAIQSAAGIKIPFNNWFEALEYMENEIYKIDFDICIIGCGAYGLPLAAYIKRMGKKAIHLGGGTQLLFGIRGKRWENKNYGMEYNIPGLFQKSYSSLFNKNWIKPLSVDTPRTANKIDGACYW